MKIYIIIGLIAFVVGVFMTKKHNIMTAICEPDGKVSSGRILCFAIIGTYLYRGGDIPQYMAGCAVLFYFATRVDKELIKAVIYRWIGIKEADVKPAE